MKIIELDAVSSEFLELPWRIYTDQHAWVPPLKASIQQELSDENLFFEHGRAALFLAEREGEICGRIVASVDDNLLQQDVGHFGYFECIDDAEIAAVLLQRAEQWCKAQGKTQIHGPINLNIYGNYRLQTRGFDTPPFLGEPRAPKYYQDLLKQAGYGVEATWNSWDIPAQIFPMLQGYMEQQAASAQGEDDAYRLEFLNVQDLERHLHDAHTAAMKSFAENYGFSKLSFEAFKQVYAGLLLILQRHPELFGLFYHGDEPVGFGYGYPNYADFFQELNGDAAGLAGFAQAEAQSMVFHSFGMDPAHRKTRMPYTVFAEAFKAAREQNMRYAIGALAREGRTAYDQLGDPSRSYSIFSRSLT